MAGAHASAPPACSAIHSRSSRPGAVNVAAGTSHTNEPVSIVPPARSKLGPSATRPLVSVSCADPPTDPGPPGRPDPGAGERPPEGSGWDVAPEPTGPAPDPGRGVLDARGVEVSSVARGLGVGSDDPRGVALGVGVSPGIVGSGSVAEGVGKGTSGVAVGAGVGGRVGTGVGVGAGVGAGRTRTDGDEPRRGPVPVHPWRGYAVACHVIWPAESASARTVKDVLRGRSRPPIPPELLTRTWFPADPALDHPLPAVTESTSKLEGTSTTMHLIDPRGSVVALSVKFVTEPAVTVDGLTEMVQSSAARAVPAPDAATRASSAAASQARARCGTGAGRRRDGSPVR